MVKFFLCLRKYKYWIKCLSRRYIMNIYNTRSWWMQCIDDEAGSKSQIWRGLSCITKVHNGMFFSCRKNDEFSESATTAPGRPSRSNRKIGLKRIHVAGTGVYGRSTYLTRMQVVSRRIQRTVEILCVSGRLIQTDLLMSRIAAPTPNFAQWRFVGGRQTPICRMEWRRLDAS